MELLAPAIPDKVLPLYDAQVPLPQCFPYASPYRTSADARFGVVVDLRWPLTLCTSCI